MLPPRGATQIRVCRYFKQLLSLQVPVQCTKHFYTSLMYHEIQRWFNDIAFLISKGCDVTLQNNKKELPLHIACKEHSMEVIRLVEECDVNASTETGDTPLHIACRRNSSNIVERLVTVKHSELTIQNNNKELPLHIACCNCSLDVVKIVSDCNASLQTVTGDTPLHIACRRCIPDMVESSM